ncbi:hypothetical protein [Bacillus pumilus]|uniref:hypothetical protein n=1 Tax=Bacillus pumilus TaxID=1408 RepID=UPI003CF797FE
MILDKSSKLKVQGSTFKCESSYPSKLRIKNLTLDRIWESRLMSVCLSTLSVAAQQVC